MTGNIDASRGWRTPHTVVEENPLRIQSHDGYLLGATHYAPCGQREPKDVLIFNGGGGLSARRYSHFLRYLASDGFSVLAYDYRGVGASRPERLGGFNAGLEDWAERDHAAVIDFARDRYPCAQMTSVSHSIGCLVACIAPNAASLHRMVHIGPHTGYWRDYRTPWRWPMLLMWHGVMPCIARVCGYFPGSALRLGDDFPLRFALQWAGRCTPEFTVSTNPDDRSRATKLMSMSRDLTVPALIVTFSDDAFASEAGVARFLALVPNVRTVRCEFASSRERSIGHVGFFSRRNAHLWRTITNYLHDNTGSVTRNLVRHANALAPEGDERSRR